jgi:hypothetical protein
MLPHQVQLHTDVILSEIIQDCEIG